MAIMSPSHAVEVYNLGTTSNPYVDFFSMAQEGVPEYPMESVTPTREEADESS